MATFQILGPVRLLARDRNVDLGSAKIRGLLGILLLHADTAVSVDLIIERLWDDSDEIDTGRGSPPNPRKTLQGYVSKLRRLLRGASAPAVVRTEHGSYRLQIDPGIVDLHRFRRLSDDGRTAARQGDHAGAIAAFEAAIELWHGRPLADVHSSWSTRNGESLIHHELLPAHVGLLQAHSDLGNHDEVLVRLRPLLMTYETYEPFIRLRMTALAAVDGPGSVTTCFHDYTRKARDLLDAEPSDDLVRLYRKLTQPPPAVPSIRAVPARPVPQQLPRDIPDFIGRSDILAQLDDLLGKPNDPAVVSLDGGPGVGKTAVAIRWAHSRRDRFADGTLYADLNGYGPGSPASAASVLATFLDGLGIAHNDLPRDPSERASLLRRELAGKRILVVLDNARDSAHVRPLLAATSPSPVLITSRQKLDKVAYQVGARCLTVPTLLLDDAIALLQSRIGQERVVNDLPAIHALAALCSSTPLALRIAGEHVATRPDAPIQELVRHLRGQRRLLDAGSHGDDESTKLRAVIGWSTDALPADADRLFCLLGVHPSTQVSTPAAAALVGWTLDRTEGVFDILVGAHLAHQHGADSFKMHDLLHLFANDRAETRLTPEERREAVHRQVDWCLASVSAAVAKISPQRRPVPPLALATSVQPMMFEDDQQALNWCVGQRPQILAITKAAVRHQLHHHVWRLVGTFDDILGRYGDPSDTVDLHQSALDAARITGSRDGEAGTLNNLGVIHFYLGQYERAAHYYSQALAIARETEDEMGESTGLYNIGTTLLERGIHQKAIEFYRQSLAIADRNADRSMQARAYHRLGDLHQRWERPDDAENFYQRALRIWTQDGDIRGQAVTLAKLGELHAECDRPQEAVEYCERALRISREVYDQRKVAEALIIRGAAQYQLGMHDESIASVEEAAALCRGLHHARGEARALEILAEAQYFTGDAAQADDNRAKALSLVANSDPVAVRIRAALNAPRSTASSVPGQREKGGRPVSSH